MQDGGIYTSEGRSLRGEDIVVSGGVLESEGLVVVLSHFKN